MRHPVRATLTGALTALTLVLTYTGGAAAVAPVPGPRAEGVTIRTVEMDQPSTLDDLPSGSTVDVLPSGSLVVSVPGPSAGSSGPQGRLSVGVGTTIYLYLTRTDQTVLMGVGGGGIIAMACLSLGAAGCIGVSAAVGGAIAWVSVNGFCPKRLEIAVARGYKCVS